MEHPWVRRHRVEQALLLSRTLRRDAQGERQAQKRCPISFAQRARKSAVMLVLWASARVKFSVPQIFAPFRYSLFLLINQWNINDFPENYKKWNIFLVNINCLTRGSALKRLLIFVKNGGKSSEVELQIKLNKSSKNWKNSNSKSNWMRIQRVMHIIQIEFE